MVSARHSNAPAASGCTCFTSAPVAESKTPAYRTSPAVRGAATHRCAGDAASDDDVDSTHKTAASRVMAPLHVGDSACSAIRADHTNKHYHAFAPRLATVRHTAERVWAGEETHRVTHKPRDSRASAARQPSSPTRLPTPRVASPGAGEQRERRGRPRQRRGAGKGVGDKDEERVGGRGRGSRRCALAG